MSTSTRRARLAALAAATCLASFASITTATAQTATRTSGGAGGNWYATLGAASAPNPDDSSDPISKRTGAEVSVGYVFRAANLYLAPSIGAFIFQGDNNRYQLQTQGNGTEVCRDLTNGQYSKKANCDNTRVTAYGNLEGGIRLGDDQMWAAGIGARVQDKALAYAVVHYGRPGGPNLRVAAGKDYGALGVTFGF